jgi:hypothetical protein
LTDLLDFAFFFFAAKAGDVPATVTLKHKQVSNSRVNLLIKILLSIIWVVNNVPQLALCLNQRLSKAVHPAG